MKENEKKYRGVFEKVPGSGVWWIRYFVNGKKRRERVGKKSLAIKRYQIRKAQVYEGRFLPAAGASMADLKELLFENYRLNGYVLKPIKASWNRLKDTFGGMRADQVTTEQIERYIRDRAIEEYANASINRDLASLKRMFHLGIRASPPRVRVIPAFPARLKEAPPRSGFVGDSQYRALQDEPLELWLQAFLAVAYKFGLRRGELLSLRVGQVDLKERVIRLNAGETKNDEARIAPMTSEVHELLEECVRGKGPQDYVFTRGKRRVMDFRGTWETLTKQAGLPGLLVHDLRRSAVRNMVRRGIPEKIAMAISGHKTREVFDRYNIVSESDILEAGRKLEDRSDPRTDTRVLRRGRVDRGKRRIMK